MSEFLYWIILWFHLVVIENRVYADTPLFAKSSAIFELKLDLAPRNTSLFGVSMPIELHLGPRYSLKKSEQPDSPPPDFHTGDHFNSHVHFNDSISTNLESLVQDNDDNLKFNKHRKWTVSNFLNYNDVPFDVHEVTTEDGYMLTVFRLFPCKLEESETPELGADPTTLFEIPGITIYLHGLMSSAVEWLIGDPEAIYPYDAVSRRQEVWLVNFRGNEYGMKHKRLSTLAPAFWKFSFHEQGVYDMPALVDYILEHSSIQLTKRNPKMLNFFAQGVGATVFYIFMEFHGKKYRDKINLMTAISPIAFNSRSASPIRNLIPYIKHFKAFPTDGPLLKSTIVDFLHVSVPELCILKTRGRSWCDPILQFFNGDGKITPAVVRRIAEHFPSTTSKRNMVHFLQLLQSDVFRQFDHGMKLNFLYYNQSAPPPYNLFKVNIPTVTFYGQTDVSIDPRDVEQTTRNFGTSPNGHAVNQVFDYHVTDLLYSADLPRACNALVDSFTNNRIYR